MRDAGSDNGAGGGTASNSACDGTEDCVYYDRVTGLYWSKDNGSTYTWENAITRCDGLSYGGYSDWRLPTQKEAMRAYINGISIHRTSMNFGGQAFTSTTQSAATTAVWFVGLTDGWTETKPKTDSYRVVCVR